MRVFRSMAISASALTAERLRLDLISNNIANAQTTRTARGGPYRRQVAVFAEKLEQASNGLQAGAGVKVEQIAEDNTEPIRLYDPSHPDADQSGFVLMPNINVTNEVVDMMTASRAYEANLTVFNTGKALALKALEIGRG